MKEMKLNCSTCKAKLKEGDEKYCAKCIKRVIDNKARRAAGSFSRDCKECGVSMLNPAPNKKWCGDCGLDRKRTQEKIGKRIIRK